MRGTPSGLAFLVIPLGLHALLCACPESPASASRADAPPFDAQRAWKHLEAQVALGPRPSGSAAAEAARKYIEGELASYGLTPVREPFVGEGEICQGVEFCN